MAREHIIVSHAPKTQITSEHYKSKFNYGKDFKALKWNNYLTLQHLVANTDDIQEKKKR